MLKRGILNPALNCLLSRVRHTNTLVIADRGFPSWPGIEIIDLSLVDGIPTVLDVLGAIRENFVIGGAWMANEFRERNDSAVLASFEAAMRGIPVHHEPHVEFKKRVPCCSGIVRTGDTIQYANIIIESA